MITFDEPKVKRRFRSKQERRQIAEESLQPGTSVAVVARRHGVNANQVFLWRKLYQKGLLDAKRKRSEDTVSTDQAAYSLARRW